MSKNGNIWTLCDKLVAFAFMSFVITMIYAIGANLEIIKGLISA